LWGVVANRFGVAGRSPRRQAASCSGWRFIPRFRLAAAEALDLEPSAQLADPVVAEELADDAGPVLVMVELYDRAGSAAAFAAAARNLLSSDAAA